MFFVMIFGMIFGMFFNAIESRPRFQERLFRHLFLSRRWEVLKQTWKMLHIYVTTSTPLIRCYIIIQTRTGTNSSTHGLISWALWLCPLLRHHLHSRVSTHEFLRQGKVIFAWVNRSEFWLWERDAIFDIWGLYKMIMWELADLGNRSIFSVSILERQQKTCRAVEVPGH